MISAWMLTSSAETGSSSTTSPARPRAPWRCRSAAVDRRRAGWGWRSTATVPSWTRSSSSSTRSPAASTPCTSSGSPMMSPTVMRGLSDAPDPGTPSGTGAGAERSALGESAIRSTPSSVTELDVGSDQAVTQRGRALPTTRLADDRQHLAALDVERHTGHRLHDRRQASPGGASHDELFDQVGPTAAGASVTASSSAASAFFIGSTSQTTRRTEIVPGDDQLARLDRIHLGAKQPAGSAEQRRRMPPIGTSSRSGRSRRSSDSRQCRWYGCCGRWNASTAGADSTISPAYITCTVGQSRDDAEVVGDQQHRSPRLSCSERTSRICAWTVTSSAVVGSSAITISGSLARAMAISPVAASARELVRDAFRRAASGIDTVSSSSIAFSSGLLGRPGGSRSRPR